MGITKKKDYCQDAKGAKKSKGFVIFLASWR